MADNTTPDHVTIVETQRNGNGGMIFGIIALVVLGALAFWFFSTQQAGQSAKDASITAAAQKVGAAAEKVGNAAQDAVKNN